MSDDRQFNRLLRFVLVFGTTLAVLGYALWYAVYG